MNKSSYNALSLVRRSRSASSIMIHNQCPTRKFSQIAENQIAAWLQQGGAKNLQNKGKKLERDKHRQVANALGVGDDYVHSKILSDNNFKPESIERRLEMDQKWEDLQQAIQEDYTENRSLFVSIQDYTKSSHAKGLFGEAIAELDAKAKKVNDAIISDSLRFNGRAPVPHARRFRLAERIEEAIDEADR